MKLLYTKSYDNTIKYLKKYHQENYKLNEILELINNSNNFNELKINPITRLFHFEQLKYELNDFYSFRLNDKLIRLIVRPPR